MENRKEKDSIERIIESAGEKYEAAAVTEMSDGSTIEFEFHSERVGGLVFERVDDIEISEPPISDVVSDEPLPRDVREEFDIPESFTVDSDYDKPLKEEEPPRIWTTYVPRFTEVSDNYRMARTMRGAAAIKKRSDTGSAAPQIDPLAEIDENVDVAGEVVVSSPKRQDLPGESISVYKFKTEDEPTYDEPEEEDITDLESDEPEAETEDESESAVFLGEAEILGIEEEQKEEPPKAEEEKKPKAVSNYYSVPLDSESREPEEDADIESYGWKLQRGEYTSFARRDSFKDKFLDKLLSVKVRFFAALLLLVLAAVFENLWMFGINIADAFSFANISWAIPLIDMQIVLCALALCIPELIIGFRSMSAGRITSTLLVPVSAIVYVIYCAVLMGVLPSSYAMFGFVFTVSALMLISSSYFGVSADFAAFRKASKNGEKKIINNKYTRTLERENKALDGAIEEHKSKIARVFKTLFASDIFARQSHVVENKFNVIVGLSMGIGAGAVTAIIAYFACGGIAAAMAGFALVTMMAFPAISYIIFKLPYFHAQKEAMNEDSVLIGESSVDEYSGIDVVTFEDTEVFGSEDVSLKQVMLYGAANDISKPLRQMAALFSVAGGPLKPLFLNSLDRHCVPAAHTVIEADGISGYVEGSEVMAGSREFMVRRGVYIPDEPVSQHSAQHSTRVMYAAEAGKVYAKFLIRYSFSENFTMLLPVLRGEGMIPLIYTRDPNVTNDLVMTLTAGADTIRVMKKTTCDGGEAPVYRRASSGIVTVGDKNNAINMLLLSKKSLKFRTRMQALEMALMSVSAGMAALLTLMRMSLISSLVFGGWQLAWCLAVYVMSRSTYNVRKIKKEENDEE